jgi:hypothetical protein
MSLFLKPRIDLSALFTTSYTPRPRLKPWFVVDLNAAVLAYARARLGSQVGRGECWDLAYAALAAAGARLPGTNGLGTYEFGRLVTKSPGGAPWSVVWAGDIIQFFGFGLTAPDGTGRYSFPQHTAIVAQVNGQQVTVIEQNSAGRRYVTQATYDFGWDQSGECYVYRPQSP